MVTFRMCGGKQVFLENNIKFTTAVDLIKCLEQIELSSALYTCVPISEYPSKISTIVKKN